MEQRVAVRKREVWFLRLGVLQRWPGRRKGFHAVVRESEKRVPLRSA